MEKVCVNAQKLFCKFVFVIHKHKKNFGYAPVCTKFHDDGDNDKNDNDDDIDNNTMM